MPEHNCPLGTAVVPCCPLLHASNMPKGASPQDDRWPWPPPPATRAHHGAGGSPVLGPTLGGDSSTGQGCTGRAGCRSRRRRRFGCCRSSALAARSSGRDAFLPLAPSCLERPPRQSKRNLACPAIPRASLQLGTLCARESRAGRTTCDYDRKGGLSCGVGRPPVSAVVRDLPVGCGPDVAPGSRAWKALSRARLGPAPTPNWEVRDKIGRASCRERVPFARARRGHGWLGQDHSPVVAALGLAWMQVRPTWASTWQAPRRARL